jgi:hypothetical protein
MHTVELLKHAVGHAQQLGYTVRQEWLGGAGGGACEVQGRKFLFLDVTASPRDQLDQVVDALRSEPSVRSLPLCRELDDLLTLRKSA